MRSSTSRATCAACSTGAMRRTRRPAGPTRSGRWTSWTCWWWWTRSPVATAAMAAMPGKAEDLNPNRAVYLLPACTQFETSGSLTASNRSIQWREKVIEPLFESRSDHMIMVQLAEKLGFAKELTKNYKMQKVKGMDEPVPEDIMREWNRALWTIGYDRPEPGAHQGPHAQHARLRREHSARQGRHRQADRLQARWRLLRLALALLRHARAQAPGLAEPVRHVQARDGRWRQLPRQFRCRA
jgi:anaerobic selenocysteine-containing dehydrogenase